MNSRAGVLQTRKCTRLRLRAWLRLRLCDPHDILAAGYRSRRRRASVRAIGRRRANTGPTAAAYRGATRRATVGSRRRLAGARSDITSTGNSPTSWRMKFTRGTSKLFHRPSISSMNLRQGRGGSCRLPIRTPGRATIWIPLGIPSTYLIPTHGPDFALEIRRSLKGDGGGDDHNWCDL